MLLGIRSSFDRVPLVRHAGRLLPATVLPEALVTTPIEIALPVSGAERANASRRLLDWRVRRLY